MSKQQKFYTGVLTAKSGIYLPLPFEPDDVWGFKPVHRVTGTINGSKFRGPLAVHDGQKVIKLRPAWVRDATNMARKMVEVAVQPEGPLRDDLDPDIAAALEAAPNAATFFDGLAQFYRKKYLT